MSERRTFPVFRTITLGTVRFGSMFHDELFAYGFRAEESAEKILSEMAFGPAETQLDLVVVRAVTLGLEPGGRRDVLYVRALECGLELCPAEVGPQLRLQYRDQPFEEVLHIAMEPIPDPDDDTVPVVFCVDSLGARGKVLGIRPGVQSWYVSGGDRWVFVQPRR